jgi:hypothetical protein
MNLNGKDSKLNSMKTKIFCSSKDNEKIHLKLEEKCEEIVNDKK